MRCERCGAELTNKIIKVNGVYYCENCARELGLDKYLSAPTDLLANAFSPLDEIAGGFMKMADLDFGNSRITCPKCGMSMREFENKGRVGCIECYNTFKEYLIKEMKRQQGEVEYEGRKPGMSNGIKTEAEDIREEAKELPKAPEAQETTPAKDDNIEEKIAKLEKADLGMLTDEELEEGMKLATQREDFALAIRLRDELNGRKGA
ncbi:MAG: hypothetical protein K5745_01390 [Saccharofermentans sp.]|nr:hypothetical protein [Saccharofermentans sp.]